MIKLKIKAGDTVQVIAGDHKGEKGKVLKVEGVNLVSKHTKPSAQNPQGGIIKKEAPIHISNLSLLDPKTGEITRVGYEQRDGKKVRISKKSKQVV